MGKNKNTEAQEILLVLIREQGINNNIPQQQFIQASQRFQPHDASLHFFRFWILGWILSWMDSFLSLSLYYFKSLAKSVTTNSDHSGNASQDSFRRNSNLEIRIVLKHDFFFLSFCVQQTKQQTTQGSNHYYCIKQHTTTNRASRTSCLPYSRLREFFRNF